MVDTFALVLASRNGWHHGHCWIIVPILVLVIGAIVASVLLRRKRGPKDGDGGGSPRRILAERFARGEISGEEYRDRLAQLQ